MPKLRVHELAKKLNKTNKELLDFLHEKEISVYSHMSFLSEEQVQMVEKVMSGNSAFLSYGSREEKVVPETKKVVVEKVIPETKKIQNKKRSSVSSEEIGALNQLYETVSQEEKQQIINEMEKMEQIVLQEEKQQIINEMESILRFVKKNLKGELSAKDIEEFKMKFSEWKESIQKVKAGAEKQI